MTRIAAFLKETQNIPASTPGRPAHSFADASIKKLSAVIRESYLQWENSSKKGFLQSLDARIKTAFLLLFVLGSSLTRRPATLALVCTMCFFLALVSRISLRHYLFQVLSASFLFGFLVGLPATLNIITPGRPVFHILSLESGYTFWIYHVPDRIYVTRQGLDVMCMLTLRVASPVSVTFLIMSVTPFSELLRSLKYLRVPDAFLVILSMTYRHILLFALSVQEFYLAYKCRSIGRIGNARAGEIVASRIAIVFKKSTTRAEQVYTAMRARGFSGKTSLPGFQVMPARDLSCLGFTILAAIAIFLLPEII